jgi:hypothetical protein
VSDFIESLDDMIGHHFATEAVFELETKGACEVKSHGSTQKILYKLIRGAIAHARSQAAGRTAGTMTFEEAMDLARSGAIVTRPGWDIFQGLIIRDGAIFYWKLDNCDGVPTGNGWPCEPNDEDRAATDWMLYQAPQDNWVELNFS